MDAHSRVSHIMGSADGSLCSGTYGEGGCDEPHLALLPAALAMDGSGHFIWEAADTIGEAYLEYDLGEKTWIQATGLDEPDRWPRYRQSIRMEAETDQGWVEVLTAQTRGHGLVQKFVPIQAQRVRIHVDREAGPPAIAEWQLYAPE